MKICKKCKIIEVKNQCHKCEGETDVVEGKIPTKEFSVLILKTIFYWTSIIIRITTLKSIQFVKFLIPYFIKYLKLLSKFTIKFINWLLGPNKKVLIGFSLILVLVVSAFMFFRPSSNTPMNSTDFEPYIESIDYSDKRIEIEVEELGLVIDLPEELSDDALEFKIEPIGETELAYNKVPEWVEDSFIIDVSLGDKHFLPGIAEIKINYDKSLVPKDADPEKYITAMYFNEDTKEWEYAHYDVVVEDSSVTIKTMHFSVYSFFFGGEHREDIDETKFTEKDAQIFELGTKAGTKAAFDDINDVLSVSSKLGAIADASSKFTEEANVVEFISTSSSLKAFNDALANYGDAVLVYKVATAISEGKDLDVVLEFVKKGSDILIGKIGTASATFAGVAVFPIDYALDKFVKLAFTGHEAKWEEVHEFYYDHPAYQGKSIIGWRDYILAIVDSHPKDEYYGYEPYSEYIEGIISDNIDDYLSIIWNDIVQASFVSGELGYEALGVPSQAIQEKITKNFKKTLYDEKIIPAMASVEKIMEARFDLERQKEIQKLVKELTEDKTIFLQINGVTKGYDDMTFSITSENNQVLLEGDVNGEDIIFKLEDYIALGDNNYTMIVTYKENTYVTPLPDDFALLLYNTVNVEIPDIEIDEEKEEEVNLSREDVLDEYGLNELQQEAEKYYLDTVSVVEGNINQYSEILKNYPRDFYDVDENYDYRGDGVYLEVLISRPGEEKYEVNNIEYSEIFDYRYSFATYEQATCTDCLSGSIIYGDGKIIEFENTHHGVSNDVNFDRSYYFKEYSIWGSNYSSLTYRNNLLGTEYLKETVFDSETQKEWISREEFKYSDGSKTIITYVYASTEIEHIKDGLGNFIYQND